MTSAIEQIDLTSLTLLKGIRDGDNDSWIRLVSLYAPLVWAWCRRSGIDRVDVEDVTQEVFASVYSGLASFRHEQDGDTLRGWIRVIARNTIHDHFRRRNRIGQSGYDIAIHHAVAKQSADFVSRDVRDDSLLIHSALHIARTNFKPNVWEAFERTTIGNATAVDVADELGMTPAAVRQAKLRVLRHLRENYGEFLLSDRSISVRSQT